MKVLARALHFAAPPITRRSYPGPTIGSLESVAGGAVSRGCRPGSDRGRQREDLGRPGRRTSSEGAIVASREAPGPFEQRVLVLVETVVFDPLAGLPLLSDLQAVGAPVCGAVDFRTSPRSSRG